MKLRIDRAELLTELAPMQGVVERKSTIPVLSHILLRTRDGKLHLAATDLEVSLTSWCDAEIEQDGALAVQARKFHEIVRALVADTLDLTLEGGGQLRIVGGRSRFKIHGLSPDDFPSLPEVAGPAQVTVPYADFRRMIGKVLYAVSTEESRFQLNGALLKLKKGGVELVATDGHRLALVENALAGIKDAEAVVIPRKALQEILRFEGSEEIKFRKGEHHLSFVAGRRELICRILEGTFPDYEKVIARDHDKKVLFNRRQLSEVVQRVALLTGDRARAIRLKLSEGQLVVLAANPDLGEAVEEVDCGYSGPDLEVGMNPDYLEQFLAATETEQIQLEFKDEHSQCLGVPVEGPDARYLCVIMPMRL